MGMTREEAITIARYCAKEKPQSYYAEPFQPHEWVIDAILHAAARPATAAPADRVFCEAIKYSFVCNLRRGHDGDHMDWDASGGCIGWSASTPASREPK
jgi:hypothetical protein